MGARPGAVRRGRALDPAVPTRPATEPQWDRDGMHSGIGGLAHVLVEIARLAAWTAAGVGAGGRDRRPAAVADRRGHGRRPTSTGWSVTSRCWRCWASRASTPAWSGCSPLGPADWEHRNDVTLGTGALVHGGLVAAAAGCVRGLDLAAYAAGRAAGRGGGDAGRAQLAVRPAPARAAGQARGRPPGRDAELVARTGRDRRRAGAGRGGAGADRTWWRPPGWAPSTW